MNDLFEQRRLIRSEVTGVIGEVELHLASQTQTSGKLIYYYGIIEQKEESLKEIDSAIQDIIELDYIGQETETADLWTAAIIEAKVKISEQIPDVETYLQNVTGHKMERINSRHSTHLTECCPTTENISTQLPTTHLTDVSDKKYPNEKIISWMDQDNNKRRI